MMGEMGRTPRVNAQAGRDHWSQAQSVLFAGGGVKPGMVIGATDQDRRPAPTADPVGVEDILRTIFHQMGIDSTKAYHTPLGRPVPDRQRRPRGQGSGGVDGPPPFSRDAGVFGAEREPPPENGHDP